MIDAKNLANHQECFVVEICKFFPYPDVSCNGKDGKICTSQELKLPQPDKILLAVIKSNFDGATVKVKIKVEFDPLQEPDSQPSGSEDLPSKTKVPSGPKSSSVVDDENINLQLPTVTPHPKNLLTGDITSDGYSNCGNIKFNDFRVWYSKEQNNIEFYAEGVEI